ncbi:MAG: hypothetical protein HKN78_02125 [Sphingomonadaceae bacterium]|nr:hypothetical protein [Sphingomonadaceae bacterium]
MLDKLLALGAASAIALTGYVSGYFDDGADAVPTGRIYHYVRDTRAGDENIYVYRAGANHVEVYTMTGRCRDAEYLSAWVDPTTGRAAMMTSGRLMPEARHENFMTIAFDGVRGRLSADAILEDRMVSGAVTIDEPVWHLRDFELATLSVQTMGLADPRGGFAFALPTTTGEGDDYLQNLGRIDAEFVTEEDLDGRQALRFELTGPALANRSGSLWLDADGHHVIAANLDLPGEGNRDNFTLRLTEISDGGEAGWGELLHSHYDGCATA